MADTNDLVRELKKMNEFLEKIDWKLWNLHKKFIEDAVPTTTVVSKETDKNVEPVVTTPATPKYPTIETWE
jgi:hypothetical protein